MSTIQVRDGLGNLRDVDTFSRTEDAKLVHTQATALVDPADGSAILPANQATQAAMAASQAELVEAIQALRMSIGALTRTVGLTTTDTSGRMRTVLEGASSTAALTVANLSGASGYLTNDLMPGLYRLTGASLRSNITVT